MNMRQDRWHMQHPLNEKAELTEENAFNSVHEALYVFLALIYGGSDILDADIDEDVPIDEYKKAAKLRKRILDVSQDITYGVSSGKIIPPKQYAFGLATHQISGRSKKLVNILSNAGQIIPYKKLLKADTALAEKIMKKTQTL